MKYRAMIKLLYKEIMINNRVMIKYHYKEIIDNNRIK